MSDHARASPRALWRCAFQPALLLALLLSSRCAFAADLGWTAPAAARVMTWAGRGAARSVAPDEAVSLLDGELLVIPVRPGDRVRVEGDVAELGLGSGFGALPDTVVWWTGAARAGLFVPTWSSARFAVLRARSSGGVVRARVAAAAVDALRWHRYDAEIAHAFATGADVPEPPAPGEALARELAATRVAFDEPSLPELRALLQAKWLEGALRLRPIVTPYFVREPVTLTGAWQKVVLEDGEWFEIAPRGTLVLDSAAADVAVLTTRGTTGQRTVARVYEGERLLRVIDLSASDRAQSVRTFTTATSLRAVFPPLSRRLRVEVSEGTLQLRCDGFRQRTELFDAVSQQRNRASLLREAARSRSILVRALATADSRGSPPALGASSPTKRALILLVESARARAGTTITALPPAAALVSSAIAAPLVRAVLEHQSRLQRLPTPSDWHALAGALLARGDLRPEDAEPLSALLAGSGPLESGRPMAAPRAESVARSTGDGAMVALARSAWQRETTWRAMDPAPGSAVEQLWVTPSPNGQCGVRGPTGTRWLLIDRTPRLVDLAATGGTHAKVQARGLPSATQESQLLIDETPIAVHSLTGLASFAAVAPGAHRFRVVDGPAVLVRVDSDAAFACADLRERRTWSIAGRAEFVLPHRGDETAARVLVDGASGTAHVLRLEAGGASFDAWLRPQATGSVEVPLPREASTLAVMSSAPVRVRAAARLRPDVASLPPTSRLGVLPGRSRDELLRALREATRRVREAPTESERRSALVARAQVLDRLGYATLGELDRTRSGHGSAAAVPELDAENDDAIELPLEAAAVVPLGLLPRVPPLPAPADDHALLRARRALEGGSDEPSLIAELQASAQPSASADALLLAELARRNELHGTAATLLERIGERHGSAAALAAAASSFANVAAESGDMKLAQRAYALARRAVELGDEATAALGKLSPAMAWRAATHAESFAGTATLEHAAEDTPAAAAALVRRALLDAPDDAVLLTERRTLELRTRSRKAVAVSATSLCHSLSAGDEACSVVFRLDGRSITCSGDGRTAAAAANSESCAIVVPAGDHRLTAELPPVSAALGWVAMASGNEAVLSTRIVSEWLEIDPARPLRLSIAGPTVVRVTARSAEAASHEVQVSLAQAGTPTRDERLALPTEQDATARRARVPTASDNANPEAIGKAVELLLPLLRAGRHVLNVRSPAGRVLLRVEAAFARTPPRAGRPRLAPSTLVAAAPDVSQTATLVVAAPTVSEETKPWVATVAGYAALAESELVETDADARARYLELGVRLHRELVPARAWFSIGAFSRLRAGPLSSGGEVRLDVSSAGALPGLFARGRVAAQPVDAGLAWGVAGTLGAYWSASLHPDYRLVPWFSQLLRSTDDRARRLAANRDPDVYSTYDDLHPRATTIGVRLDQRPLVDTLLRYGVSARSTPALSGIDRWDARVEVDTVPGTGFTPWLGATTLVSYRPVTDNRDLAFVRLALSPHATLWHWWSGNSRTLLQASGTYVIDAPATPRSHSLTLLIALTHEYSGGRGLRDHAPRNVPFRDRLEEGSGLVRRAPPALPAAWVTPP